MKVTGCYWQLMPILLVPCSMPNRPVWRYLLFLDSWYYSLLYVATRRALQLFLLPSISLLWISHCQVLKLHIDLSESSTEVTKPSQQLAAARRSRLSPVRVGLMAGVVALSGAAVMVYLKRAKVWFPHELLVIFSNLYFFQFLELIMHHAKEMTHWRATKVASDALKLSDAGLKNLPMLVFVSSICTHISKFH